MENGTSGATDRSSRQRRVGEYDQCIFTIDHNSFLGDQLSIIVGSIRRDLSVNIMQESVFRTQF